ncbi:DNA translocase SpoIIIE [Caloramator mitchellensis]|uniref:DNA translocase SpoIIIE n=1 Tax=Caloramator mitchellensis TaxID=908809 RepID=A0A0R3JTZ5_CALMK|nr:DNA translocase FtsK [Caloramator mitchellensis]KRQ87003.1 DNA translocase SpoIIIE [Caloramator mitchellensis]
MGKAKNKNQKFITEIYGIITTAVSLLIIISIFFKPTGIVGKIFVDFFFGLLGIGAYLFPFALILIGIFMIINKNIKLRQRFVAIWLLIFDIVLFIHVKYSNEFVKLKFKTKLIKIYNIGITRKGGGILSELIDLPLLKLFGEIGAYIVLTAIAIILVILITEKSVGDIIKFMLTKIHNFNLNMKTKEKANKQLNEELDENIDENENSEINIVEPIKIKEHDSFENKKGSKLINLNNSDNGKENKNKSEDVNINIPSENLSQKNIHYTIPPINILSETKIKSSATDKKELINNAKALEETLQSFGIEAKVVQVTKGPSVTRYELHPGAGVKVSRIVNLADDIALNLAAPSVRIEAPIPGKSAIGIEVPNKEVIPVSLREVIESEEFIKFNSPVAFALGKDISGKCVVTDIAKMPHLLIAGATGSGKSVCINTLITSLIYKSSPNDVKMLLIDPKVVELSIYNGIPHLIIPVVTEPKKAASALEWAVLEMTNRYKLFADNNVRNIESYNKLMEDKGDGVKLPKIVVIIDELADLMMVAPNEVEDAITRLAQMARAAGIHLIIATQRPSVDVITGVIKANIPSRISFAVSSQIDSRTILDMAGAEKLLGKGDMLFLPIGENKPIRIQGAFISEKEVENIVEYLKKSSEVEYNEDIIEKINQSKDKVEFDEEADELLPEAIELAVELGQISASMIQRRLRVGFNRAARLIEEMEKRGVVGPQDGSKPRQVLITKDEF